MQTTDQDPAALSSDRILQLEKKKRVFLIYVLSLIGSAVCLIFGIHNLSEGLNIVGVTVISIAILACTPVQILPIFFYSGNADFAVTIMGVVLLALGGFLLVSGGYFNTGILWIYPLIAIAIFTNNFRTGLIYSCFFVTPCTLLLFIPDNPLMFAAYSLTVKIRFLVTLTVLLILCLTAEYSNEHLRRQVLRLHNQLVLAANTDSLTQLPNRRYIFDFFR